MSKKISITKFILLFIFCFIIAYYNKSDVYANYSDVQPNEQYIKALEKLSRLEIVKGYEDGTFRPNNILTREQFAKIIIVASGIDEYSQYMKDSFYFHDVLPDRWSSGYINLSVEKGYLVGMPDGNFHPEESITFEQACTVLVRMLGYTQSDLQGYWPDNYVNKAREIGLTNGISFKYNEALTRWAVVSMVDKLLSAKVKKSTNNNQTSFQSTVNQLDTLQNNTTVQNSDKTEQESNSTTAKSTQSSNYAQNQSNSSETTFIESVGLVNTIIVLENSTVNEKLQENQIVTDKGIFYLDRSIKKPEIGFKYDFKTKDDKIIKIYGKSNSINPVTVLSSNENIINYIDQNKNKATKLLPEKTVYYYLGNRINYESLKNIIQANTSIIFGLNEEDEGYEYAIIYDPVFGKPEIGFNLDIQNRKIGSIELTEGIEIIKNNENRPITSIEKFDVVYCVKDIWGKNPYILIKGNYVEGKINNFLPNRASARQIVIDNKTYDLSRYVDQLKIRNDLMYNINDTVKILFGYDGKVVGIVFPDLPEINFGIVLNYYQVFESKYSVKLLLPDSTIVNYYVEKEPKQLKGRLVSFYVTDEDKNFASIAQIPYWNPSENQLMKTDKNIGNYTVLDNVKIFNIIPYSDDDITNSDTTEDVRVSILKWSDLPSGIVIPSEKILHIGKFGEFEDVNVIVTKDIFDERYSYGVVKGMVNKKVGNTQMLAFIITVEGKDLITYEVKESVGWGSIVKLTMNSQKNAIRDLIGLAEPVLEGKLIQAKDNLRIRMNGRTFWYDNKLSVILISKNGSINIINKDFIDVNKEYSGGISFYSNKNGFVSFIILRE